MKKLFLSALAALALAAVAVAVPPTATSRPVDAACIAEDAALCGRCGDGFCNPRCGENQFTCPADCMPVPE